MSATDWIARRRELLGAATEGPWRASLLDGVRYEDGSSSYPCGIYPGATQGPPPVLVTNGIDARDAALIADARTSLPRALDALEAVLAPHQMHEVPGGQRWCLHCGADWPCPTVTAAEAALGAES